MKFCFRFLFSLLIAPLFPGALFSGTLFSAAPLPRSVSPSRQFIIYGGDVELRGAVSDLAERTKSEVLKVLRRSDNWSVPILLNLQFPQANVPETPVSELHFSQTGAGLKIQLDLTVTHPVDAPGMQRDLLRALFVEMIYRDRPQTPAGTEYTQAPPWLIEGVLARGGMVRDQAANELLREALATDNVMPLATFLQQRPQLLDAPMRVIYRAYANALLQLLLDRPEGAAKLCLYVDSLPEAATDSLTELERRFPDLADEAKAKVLWKAAVARAASSTTQDLLLGFDETERRLTELLSTPIPGPTKKSKPVKLEEFGREKPTKLQVLALRNMGENLLLLAAGAHPLLHSVVGEYQEIAQRLAARNTSKASQRFAALKKMREQLDHRVGDMTDYLNWYEATQIPEKSNAFRGYIKAASESESVRHRRDPLSVYLDTIEAQF